MSDQRDITPELLREVTKRKPLSWRAMKAWLLYAADALEAERERADALKAENQRLREKINHHYYKAMRRDSDHHCPWRIGLEAIRDSALARQGDPSQEGEACANCGVPAPPGCDRTFIDDAACELRRLMNQRTKAMTDETILSLLWRLRDAAQEYADGDASIQSLEDVITDVDAEYPRSAASNGRTPMTDKSEPQR